MFSSVSVVRAWCSPEECGGGTEQECVPGLVCRDKCCVDPPDPPSGGCTADYQCGSGNCCKNGQCSNECGGCGVESTKREIKFINRIKRQCNEEADCLIRI